MHFDLYLVCCCSVGLKDTCPYYIDRGNLAIILNDILYLTLTMTQNLILNLTLNFKMFEQWVMKHLLYF